MSRRKTPYSALRPKHINEAAWREVVSSWEDGLSDREAAFRASREGDILITEADLKEILEKNTQIADLKDYLQSDVIAMAKSNIAGSIREGSVSTSKWLLERKAANEYSTKASVNFEKAVIGLTIAEKEEEMTKFLDGFLADDDEERLDGEAGEV